MEDFVEIPDDGSDVEIQETRELNPRNNSTSFDRLKSLKREMDFRGSILGKTWSELSKIMTDYQAELIGKHEEVQLSSKGADIARLHKLEKQVTDLEHKLLSKDSEIVRLRTEVQKLRNEVIMKDSLIQKLQAQMAKEALEFQTEITALKDMLEMNNSSGAMMAEDMTPPIKRRKPNPRPQMSSASATATYPKAETSLASCAQQRLDSTSVFPSPELVSRGHNPPGPVTLYQPDGSTLDMTLENPDMDDSNEHEDIPTDDNTFYKLEDEGDSNSAEYIGNELEYDPNVDQQMMMQGSQQQQNAPIDFLLKRESGCPSPSPRTHHLAPHEPASDSSSTNCLNNREHASVLHCQICDKTFPGANRMNRHMRMHLGIRPFRCGICKKAFGQFCHAKHHVRSVHRDVSPSNKNLCVFETLEDGSVTYTPVF